MHDAVYRAIHITGVGYVCLFESETRIGSEVGNIVNGAGFQVIENDYAVSGIQQVIAQMRADKTGAARNRISQAVPPLPHGTFSAE